MLAAVAALTMAACEQSGQDPKTEAGQDAAATPHVLLLNEGAWGNNNASITLFDNRNGEVVNDWFDAANGRGMGDLGQDLVLYGSKLYATVSESGSLEVIDTATGKSQRVDMGNRYPRYIAAADGKLYVSCYNPHCVVRIDTASLDIEATCMLGDYNPEGVAVAGGTLWVASSNVSDAQGTFSYDSVLYAIDLAAFADPQRVTVGCNPQLVVALDEGRVAVNYWGDYASHQAGAAVVDAGTRQVTQLDLALSNMTVHQGDLLGYVSTYSADYSTKTTEYVRISGNTLAVSHMLEGCEVDRPYAIGVDPRNGDVLVASDGNYTAAGSVYCFTADGRLRWKHGVGYFPSRFVFLP